MYHTPPTDAARKSTEITIQAGVKRILEIQSEKLERTHLKPGCVAGRAKTEGSLKSVDTTGKSLASKTSSITAKKKQLELDAARAKAQIEKDLIDKQLEADIAALDALADEKSQPSRHQSIKAGSAADMEERVEEWMQRSHLDTMERPHYSGMLTAGKPSHDPEGSSAAIQQLAYALKDAISNTQPHANNQQILTRLSTDKELPKYYGDPMDWLHFKRAFIESTELCKFTDAENIWRLRKCLQGDAKEAVSSLLIGNTAANTIVDTLELRFGRPELIINKITSQLKKLPPLPSAYHNEIINFAVKIKNYVVAAQAIKQHEYLQSPELMTAVVSKCPPALITKWADYAFANVHVNKPKFEKFAQFLMDEAAKVSTAGISHIYSYQDLKKRPEDRRQPPYQQHAVLTQPSTTDTKDKSCQFCHGDNHTLPKCLKFKRALRKDRWRFIRSRRLCHKCMISRHDKDECPASNCDVTGCNMPHHPLLHWPAPAAAAAASPTGDSINTTTSTDEQVIESNDSDEGVPDPSPNECIESEIIAHTVSVSKSVVMLKIVPVKISGPKGVVTTYALLDDGATVSLISSDIADAVGLKGRKECLRMRGAWDKTELLCNSEIICCDISGNNCDRVFKLNARKINELNLPTQRICKSNLSKFEHINNIDVCYSQSPCKPKLLIGQDNYELIMPLKIVSGRKNEPYGTLTCLGWCVHGFMPLLPTRPVSSDNEIGPARAAAAAANLFIENNNSSIDASTTLAHQPVETSHTFFINDVTAAQSDDASLHELVRKSFALDALGVAAVEPRKNRDELRAIEILDKTSRLVDGRWEVGLPWKCDEHTMPDSFPQANRRFRSIKKKMHEDPEFSVRYEERIQHLLENEYARKLDEGESAKRIWYLPHFGVDNPNKKKLRLVFDAAAKSNGLCLNSYLLQGPDLLESLLGIMLRFRENSIGISGDIRDMFLRVKIRPEDQHALRFLWSDDVNTHSVQQYAMTSLIFGANCSPFVAQYIKNKNANRFITTMPESVQAITRNHYMDDYIDSFTNPEQAIKTMKEVTQIHGAGGLEIRNWTSNNKDVCDSIPKADLSQASVNLNFGNNEDCERALGLLWFPNSDTLGFNFSLSQQRRVPKEVLECAKKPTKRQLLQLVMSIFDIYGLLSPFTVKGKILIQSAWQNKIDWDQQITDEMFCIYRVWMTQMLTLKDIRIPRWYFSESSNQMSRGNYQVYDLHIFCDASPLCYAAVAYWRSYCPSNKDMVCVAFIISKCRVAPVKSVSIPRLELQAALLGCRLASFIKTEHRFQVSNTYFWTDSTTVLQWIRNDQRNYNTFVANRLGEIDSLSNVREWHYVPTDINIADIATKNNCHNLTNDSVWFCGPKFLQLPECEWPAEPESIKQINKSLPEMKNMNTIYINDNKSNLPVPEPSRFSSWSRLVRCTATVLLFIDKCRRKTTSFVELLKQAEILLLRQAQKESFYKEIWSLKENKNIERDSRLCSLTPFIDNIGLLRVQGRIQAVQEVSQDVKQPVILDGNHYISRLIVKFYHERAAHSNNEMVVNEIRQKYWLLRLRPTVRSVASRCLLCRLRKVVPIPPRLGDLPKGRLAHHKRPYSHCGIDLFGPIEVSVARRRAKRYGVLFTCLTVRAIHIELVPSLTADSLIMALRRMAARRGWPSTIYSDNGTNLRGAEAELKRSFKECIELENMPDTIANMGVEWKFIPPVSPNMGGAWERLIRCVKTALRVVLKERAPREETLITLLAEVENMVNSRPLTHVSVDPNTEEALTPNHFLIGSSSGSPVPGAFDDSDLYCRRQWRIAQRLSDMYWKRWVMEMLPTLVNRQKWTNDPKPLQTGDLVFVVDPNAPRNCWLRGRIVTTFPGHDGRVRVVDIRTKTGILRRPVTRVALLPQGDECRLPDTGGEDVNDTSLAHST